MRWIKRLLWVLFFIWLVIIFLPKANLFYLAENYLKEQKIIFNNEELKDILGVFNINHAEVFYDGLDVGNIERISLVPALFYNSISLKNANFSDSMKQFVPKSIKSLHVRYTLFYPIVIFISGDGNFGKIQGEVNLYKKNLKLLLTPAPNFANNYSAIASQLKKQEDKYIYETTFK